jgi:hypothetical protein
MYACYMRVRVVINSCEALNNPPTRVSFQRALQNRNDAICESLQTVTHKLAASVTELVTVERAQHHWHLLTLMTIGKVCERCAM